MRFKVNMYRSVFSFISQWVSLTFSGCDYCTVVIRSWCTRKQKGGKEKKGRDFPPHQYLSAAPFLGPWARRTGFLFAAFSPHDIVILCSSLQVHFLNTFCLNQYMIVAIVDLLHLDQHQMSPIILY